MLPVDLLLAALQAGLDRLLKQDPEGAAQFDALRGHSLLVEIENTDIRICFRVDDDGDVLIEKHAPEKPSATLRGPLSALARLTSGDRDNAVFGHGVEFTGDIGVGNRFQDALKGIEVDWEGLLAERIGDTAAHLIGRAFLQMRDWGRELAEDVPQDLAEYLREELRWFLGKDELEAWLQQIQHTRSDVDRLEARLKRLEKKLQEADQ